MALNWDWDKKMGTCTMDGTELSLYRGNAFCIALKEYENDTYSLMWFAADKNHMKNMLGLSKGFTNIVEDWGITELRLNTEYKETAEMITLLAKAKMEITIKLYKEESK